LAAYSPPVIIQAHFVIRGLGAIEKRPVVINDSIAIRFHVAT